MITTDGHAHQACPPHAKGRVAPRHTRRAVNLRPMRAFSLIELLVVIGVIALLIGILLPTLGQARLTGRATACAGRLQQLRRRHHRLSQRF
ncbi:MAG: type II secretion system protein [Phycisphaerales bacterium]|nr:type II secretion system protein [Phycisphaerales bacterium]